METGKKPGNFILLENLGKVGKICEKVSKAVEF